MPKFTKRFLDSLACPEGKAQHKVYDDANPGFGLTVGKTGRRSFFQEYVPPTGGGRRRLSLGTYGALTLEQARDEARNVLGQVRLGIDPLELRKTIAEAGSFAVWVERYLELGQASGRWAPRSLAEVKRHLRRACEAFGSRGLRDIDARTVELWRDLIHEGCGLTEANQALKSVKACFTEAWRRGHIEVNHASKVGRISGQMPRTRTLSEGEMRDLLEALEAHPDQHFKAAMMWLILTGARRSEVLRARWSDLRLDPPDQAEWTLPSPKNKRPSVRPIPGELATEIKRLPKEAVLVIGHKWTAQQFHTRWEALRAEAGLPADVHLHDLRRTAGLWLARSAGLQTAQRLLGHANISTTAKVYAPLATDDLRGPQADVVAKVLAFRRKAEGEEK